jgi:hypothetical protein
MPPGMIPLDLMPRRCPVCPYDTIVGHGGRLRQGHDDRLDCIWCGAQINRGRETQPTRCYGRESTHRLVRCVASGHSVEWRQRTKHPRPAPNANASQSGLRQLPGNTPMPSRSWRSTWAPRPSWSITNSESEWIGRGGIRNPLALSLELHISEHGC